MQAMPRAGETPFRIVDLNQACPAVLAGRTFGCIEADALMQDNSHKHFSEARRRMEDGAASGRSHANFYIITHNQSVTTVYLQIASAPMLLRLGETV